MRALHGVDVLGWAVSSHFGADDRRVFAPVVIESLGGLRMVSAACRKRCTHNEKERSFQECRNLVRMSYAIVVVALDGASLAPMTARCWLWLSTEIPQVHNTPSLQEQPELTATPVRMRFFWCEHFQTNSTDRPVNEGRDSCD